MKGEQQEVAQTSYSPVVSYYITASKKLLGQELDWKQKTRPQKLYGEWLYR